MSDHSKLKLLAEAAERQMPSPWFVHRDGMGSEFPPHPDQNFGVDDARGWAVAWHGVGRNSGIWLEEVAEFMAAANPAAVRALIVENETLRRNADRYLVLRQADVDTIQNGGLFAGLTPDNIVINGHHLDEQTDAVIAARKKVTP